MPPSTTAAQTRIVWDNAPMQRTIRVLLQPSAAQADALAETVHRFTSAFNHAARMGWDEGVSNATKLHYLAYYPVKAAHPTLVSDLINQARVKAAEALRSTATRKRAGRAVSCPQSTSCPPRYNLHTYRVDWESRTVRLSTTAGRQTIRFSVPGYAARYAGYETDTADLIQRDGRWEMHIVLTIPAPEIPPSDTVVGVDLGLAHPAVTSDNRFLGKREWKAREGCLFWNKRALQKKGTKSAKRRLRKLRRRQARFRRDCDHVLSKQIVQGIEPGATIVVENLTDIRSRVQARRRTETKRRLHSWSFAQLRRFIAYKAEERGCTVVGVDPRHTSQRCSRCGYTARNNRRSRGFFQCRSCGFSLHADLNGARNIAAKYHAGESSALLGGQPVNLPIAGNGALHRSPASRL